MVAVGIAVIVNLSIYEVYGVQDSTNWDIFHHANYSMLIGAYFYEVALRLKEKIYKWFCKLIVWFFTFDMLSQLSWLNKPYVEYKYVSFIEIKEVFLIIVAAIIVLLVDYIKKEHK